jgi:hypothetical protein
MKHQKLLIVVAAFLTFFLASCATTVENIAYVTIYNKGDLTVLASVDGTEKTLDSGQYTTWDVALGSSSSTSVDLYAELADDSRYSISETVTITAGEVYLWPIGWYSGE